jgi:type II secretion system protein N
MAADRKAVMKRVLQVGGLVLLFLASFMFFLFMTFPYEVLKESVAAEISQASGYDVRIGEMSADFPLGMTAEKVRIEPAAGGPALTLASLSVDVSVLKFLLGKVAATVEAESGGGKLELGADFGILDLIQQQPVPKRITMNAKNFPLDEAAAFGLNVATSGPNANPMVAPLISAIGVSAQLNGVADFKLDTKDPTQSKGDAEIVFNKAVLKLDHPSLGLPNQVFQKALFKAKVENGSVVVDKSSGFVAEELELLTEGKVTLKQNALASLLDLKVIFRLNKGLKERFGFIIDAVTGNPSSDGQLTMQVRGPLDNPVTTNF